MEKHCCRILSPCGILGYGFPDESFENGLAKEPDAIVVDAGSTDAGPHKLGAGVAIVSRMAYKRDLQRLVLAGATRKIPVIIGSAGGSGAKKHVDWTLDILREITEEHSLQYKLCVISADIPKETVRQKLRRGEIHKLSASVPELTEESIDRTGDIVAQMGYEPVLEALKEGADVIICGRAYDPAPFAAVGVFMGFDPALSLHMGKILECGALCAEPGTTKDCIIGELFQGYFEVYPTNPARRVSQISVAAHTFYEKDHPYRLYGPGFLLCLENCRYEKLENGHVRVSGSRMERIPSTVKLEGAALAAYRTFVIGGVRDKILISRLEEVEQGVKESVRGQYCDIPEERYQIRFINYGLNGVMGELETAPRSSVHEVGVLFEVTADTQELADILCSSLRSTFMHYGYEGRKSTAGNLAFPFAPSDISFGPVYEFSVYHLMQVDSPTELFPARYKEIGGAV